MAMREVAVGPVRVGGKNPLALIAGPCVIEEEEHLLGVAERLQEVCGRVGVALILKSSYDKANRTSLASFRGPASSAAPACPPPDCCTRSSCPVR